MKETNSLNAEILRLRATVDTFNAIIPNMNLSTSTSAQRPGTPAAEVKRSASPIKRESGARGVKKVKREMEVVDLTD